MVDFNSMLGNYSKAKNKRELQLFEQDNKDKINDPTDTGIKSKKENSLPLVILNFASLAPNNVVALLEIPGNIANIWNNPTVKVFLIE